MSVKEDIKLSIFRWLDANGYKRSGNNCQTYEDAKKYFEPELHKYVAEYLGI